MQGRGSGAPAQATAEIVTKPMKHVLILGSQGQVGQALAAEARNRGVPHVALGHAQCDITDRAAVARAVLAGPRNSALDCSRIARAFGIAQPDWRASLAALRETLSRAPQSQPILNVAQR